MSSYFWRIETLAPDGESHDPIRMERGSGGHSEATLAFADALDGLAPEDSLIVDVEPLIDRARETA